MKEGKCFISLVYSIWLEVVLELLNSDREKKWRWKSRKFYLGSCLSIISYNYNYNFIYKQSFHAIITFYFNVVNIKPSDEEVDQWKENWRVKVQVSFFYQPTPSLKKRCSSIPLRRFSVVGWLNGCFMSMIIRIVCFQMRTELISFMLFLMWVKKYSFLWFESWDSYENLKEITTLILRLQTDEEG